MMEQVSWRKEQHTIFFFVISEGASEQAVLALLHRHQEAAKAISI